ncbi:NAD(P)H-dependent oxidoreductase [Costertonia aggregata]|uniref:NAD(P)H-dependent oxidoreductase n=1 Tax=Costertonia aggregata TaxID=343403 RepID=A0A7H9ATJ3_9FLAO|nr:NAD(P)H-dependent oxidoreductase [Costertonia aggregata]QLG46801.1 NAD(P)H-dependent oxidoreductase [Costertonia aggregata]
MKSKTIIENLEWRYAVKKFDVERKLPQEKLNTLKTAFNLTATSYGLQPISMVVLENRSIQEKLVASSFGQKQVAQASHVLVICINTTIDAQYISGYFDKVRQIRGTSETILNPFKNDLIRNFSKKNQADIMQWATNQAYLALGNLLTVCAVEKIDSCPMEGFVPSAYDEILKLDEKGLSSVLVLPIGYRAEDDIFSDFKKVRKNIEDSVIEIS